LSAADAVSDYARQRAGRPRKAPATHCNSCRILEFAQLGPGEGEGASLAVKDGWKRMYPGQQALMRPDQPAIVMARSGETITYKELEARSNRPSVRGAKRRSNPSS
jgi:hypothetical protein